MPRPEPTSPQPTPPQRTPRALVLRLGALVALVLLLVAVPALVVGLVGLPDRTELSLGALSRLDEQTLVHIGLAVFAVLWGWFAVTAIAEAVVVLRWRIEHRRTGSGAEPLPPLDATPGGSIRKLVRLALVSAAVLAASTAHQLPGTASAAGTPIGAAPTPRLTVPLDHRSWPVSTASAIGTRADGPDSEEHVIADGRATPYSIAAQLGRAELREQIIATNHGRPTPDGGVWTGGVFPEGMSVIVPRALHDDGGPLPSWGLHVVRPGDSIHAIALEVSEGGSTSFEATVDAILARNLGRTMVDGRRFRDPSLIRPGWQLEVPLRGGPGQWSVTDGSSPTVAAEAPIEAAATTGRTHLVEPGDSYWSIAEDLLREGRTGAPPAAEVLATTEALRDVNAPRFDRSDPNLIHPGDLLVLPEEPHQSSAVPPVGEVYDSRPTAPTAEPPLPIDNAPAVDTVPITDGGPIVDDLPTIGPSEPVSVEPPVTVTASSVPAPLDELADDAPTRRPPLTTSLGAALLLCAGALGLIESRRRHQLRSAPRDALVVAPTIAAATTERLLRSLDGIQRAARLDLMLRCLGRHLMGSGRHVVAVLVGDDGTCDALLDAPSGLMPPALFRRVDARRWSLPAEVDTLDLSDDARLAGQPCPALVQLGTAREALTGAPAGELLVDLEAVGLLAIDGPNDDVERILLGLAASLAASPVGETLRLVTHGIDPAVHLGNLNAESAARLDDAIDSAVRTLGSTITATGAGRRRTFELRARGSGGEAWEPVVVVSAVEGTLDEQLRDELLAVTDDGGRGLAVVIGTAVPGAGVTLQATPAGWLLERFGLMVVPIGLDPAQVHVVHDLLDAAERPLASITLEIPQHRAAAAPTTSEPDGVGAPLASTAPHDDFAEPEWAVMVRLLGPVEVITSDGSPVTFDRGKSLELIAWLSTHRERPTRVGARTALWELAVRDATFANVVSEARRALARAVQPAQGEEWVVRTLTDALPLHSLVRSDVDLLRCRVEAARHLPAGEAVEVLRPGVALVRGLPFEGAGYLWPDAEGTTSELVVLATGAATSLAHHALTIGDVETVFWATSQGLRVLPGHEELVALRMRAYALHGDLAGVRMEWELYERALHSDPWSFGEPSPKLVAIRRELLSS